RARHLAADRDRVANVLRRPATDHRPRSHSVAPQAPRPPHEAPRHQTPAGDRESSHPLRRRSQLTPMPWGPRPPHPPGGAGGPCAAHAPPRGGTSCGLHRGVLPRAARSVMATDRSTEPSAEEVARRIAAQLATREVRQILREAAESATALVDELRAK